MILFPRFFTTFKCTNHLYCITGSSSSNHVKNVRPYMETGLRKAPLQVSLFCLSSRTGRFVLWAGWGERKRERAGHDGKGKERKKERFPPFPSSRGSPRAFYFFDYCYFYWDALREFLRRRQLFCNELGERQRARFPYSPLAHFPLQNFT